jgi:hypothetical protein
LTEFKEGDVVELNAPFFTTYHGRRGIVVVVVVDQEVQAHSLYINVRFESGVVGGWHPNSLILIDTEAEARAVLGDEYFE